MITLPVQYAPVSSSGTKVTAMLKSLIGWVEASCGMAEEFAS